MSSGFHRSKEVYKFTETPTGRKLVPIRGLYVSGLHTEPRYTDHLITVKNFTSSTTNVVNFTEVSRDVYTPCMQGVGIENVDPTITYYTTDTKNMNQAPCMQGVVVGNVDPTFVYYTSDLKNMNQAPCMQGAGFENVDPTIINHPISKVSMIPDHLIKVKDFTSSTTVVTNVNAV